MGAPADTGHDLWPRRIEDLRDHDDQPELSELPEILELVVEQSDPAPARFGWGALIALIAAVAIDAALVWLVRDAFAAPAPLQIVQIATALCVVPALIGILWLLAQRTSRAEARRFGQTSRAMRAEAAALEERIAILSHQIDLQRSHLNDQLAALAQTGDVAAIRLESIGRAMAAEIDRADVHAHRLTEAAQHAHELVGELLVAIPSARADAEEIGRRIDQAGLAAAAQIAGLDAQLHALTDRAHEADVVATTAAERLAGNLARMSETGDAARLRLESLSAELATTVDALVGRTERAVDQARAGLAAEGEALVVALATHQTRLDGQARDTAVALQRQIDAVGEAAEGARATLAMHGEAMVATLKSHQADLDASARGGADALERHAATVADRMRAAQTLFEDRAAALLATMQDHQATVDAGAQAGVAQLEAQAAAVAAKLDAAHHALADQGAALLATLDRHQQALGTTAREGAESLERQADAVDARLRDAHAALGTQGEAMLGTLRAHQAALDASARDGVTLLARQVEAVDGRMDAARAALTERATAMLDSIGRHHDALDTASRDGTAALEAQIAAVEAAMARARADLAAQGEAMLTLLDARRIALDQAAQDGTEALAERLDTVDRAVDHIAQRFAAQAGTADALVAGLHEAVAGVERRLDALQEQGVDRSQWLAASISALGGSADAMTEALKSGEAMATRTIGTTERLLTALDAAAREIDETLPDALARLDARIGDSRSVVAQAKPELLALVTAAGSTHDAIAAIADVIADQRRALDQLGSGLSTTLATGRDQAEALGDSVEATIDRAHRFAEDAAPRLLAALERVRDTAQDAADSARDTLSQVIPQAAASLESASAEAMRRATSDTVLRQVDAIVDATRAAVDAATGATERLAAQVRTIAEQSARVETTIADARSEREAAENDTLARRVSLLIEALNSASIDITRAFAPEVSDSAWAAYLKGDRGVFTRRAVRLLDATQSREVAELYDADAGFRDQVNRYIHDFEAMLRAILAQRDGSPLGVTLLSSDMGKLYVALAQAIERLR